METLYLSPTLPCRGRKSSAPSPTNWAFPPPARPPTPLTRALQDALVARYAQGKRVVVLIDEAHAMPAESLEEVPPPTWKPRATSFCRSPFAQPELDERLAASTMRQLRERITQHFVLDPLKPGDVAAYLEFRLRAAGYRGPNPFAERAVELIAKASEGLSRRVNILADKALAAYSAGTHRIGQDEVQTAIRDARFALGTPGPRGGMAPLAWIGVGAALAALVGILIYALGPPADPPDPKAPPRRRPRRPRPPWRPRPPRPTWQIDRPSAELHFGP